MSYFHNIKDIVDKLDADPSTKDDLVKRAYIADGEHMTANIVIFGDSGNAQHTQKEHDELLVIIDGSVRFRVGDEVRIVDPGDLVFIPRNTIHGPMLEAGENFTVLSVFGPKFDQTKCNILWERDEE